MFNVYSKRHIFHAVKRLFDIVFSLLVFVLFWWLYLGIAIAIKIDDPQAPIIFKQCRVGLNGKTFTMYKFRSMVPNAEDMLDELQTKNEKNGPVFKIKNDPRVTKVGKRIRKMSLDELPQFFNVLLGQLSVVGPRPALPVEVDQYSDYTMNRLRIKPGITCFWQTRMDRDSRSFEEWCYLDLHYVKKINAWTDFKLIIQTIGVVLTAQGN